MLRGVGIQEKFLGLQRRPHLIMNCHTERLVALNAARQRQAYDDAVLQGVGKCSLIVEVTRQVVPQLVSSSRIGPHHILNKFDDPALEGVGKCSAQLDLAKGWQ